MVLEKWFGEWPRAMSGDRMLNTTEKVVAASGTGFAVLVRIFTSQHDRVHAHVYGALLRTYRVDSLHYDGARKLVWGVALRRVKHHRGWAVLWLKVGN